MASARTASLKAQRGYSPYGTSGSIKVLAPASTGISTIAKQNAASETDIMIAKYNNGEIGNPEMKSFLEGQLSSNYITPADKTSIQKQLMDFDSLIQKDKLEATFNQAPDNSLAKAQAATALVAYYNTRASSMVAGTPAQSTALQNAASWQGQVDTINTNTNKTTRTNLQNELLQHINTLPNSSSDKANARAAMYKKLYDLAVSQGDTADAQIYANNYNQELTNAQQYADAEATQAATADRKSVLTTIGEAKNAYHDGTITADQYYQVLSMANDYAVTNGDTGILSTVNSESDRVAKLVAAGGPNRGMAGGLPVILKGTGGTGGGTVTNWDQKAFDYSDNIRLATEMLKEGKFDSTQFANPQEQYQAIISNSVQEYSTALQEEYATMDALAQTNPNQKVLFEGKKQMVGDVVTQLAGHMDDVAGQVDALKHGTAALMEIPPKQSATNPSGKAVTTYAFVDTNNIDPNTTMADTSGILHKIIMETVPMTLAEQSQVFSGVYTDPNGTMHRTHVDSAGNYTMETGKNLVETYQPGGTQKTSFQYDPANPEPIAPWNPESQVFETGKAQGVRAMTPEEIAASQARVKASKEATALPGAPTVQPTPTPKANQPAKPSLINQATDQVSVAGVPVSKIAQGVSSAVKSVAGTVANAINPAKPVPAPAYSVPSLPGVTTSKPYTNTISFPAPPPVNIPQAISSGGLKTVYTPTPTPPKVVAPTPLQKIATTISTTSPFSWLKSKLGW